jgi:hypothetical protein
VNNDSNGDGDGSGPRFITPYTEAERETLRRCAKRLSGRESKPVSGSDLLMLASTELLLMEEWLNTAFEDAKSYENPEFWSAMQELSVRLSGLSAYCEQWRAENTGKPERKTVEVRPVPPSYEFVIFKEEVIARYEELAAAVNELGISDLERRERMAALREFASTTPYNPLILKDAYARDFPGGPPL